MVTFVTILNVMSAIFMILVILVQGGNSGGMGAAFGGGSNSGGVLGTGANTFFSKLTYGAALIFMVTCVVLTVSTSKSGSTGLTDELQKKAQAEQTETIQPAVDESKSETEDKK